MHDKTCQT